MKVLTETMLRAAFKNQYPKTYSVHSGVILTPAAKQFLREKKIALIVEKENETAEARPLKEPVQSQGENHQEEIVQEEKKNPPKAKYQCYETGGFFESKPEYMAQLYGNLLVKKDHPRIQLRGKLDSFQAQILEVQYALAQWKEEQLLKDLTAVLTFTRGVLRAEVLEEPIEEWEILGLNEAQLRSMSHHPEQHFGVKHFIPEYTMGPVLVKLNSLRALSRELEIMAIKAFTGKNGAIERKDILQGLNRLSSCLYILMCRWQGGIYRQGGEGAQ